MIQLADFTDSGNSAVMHKHSFVTQKGKMDRNFI